MCGRVCVCVCVLVALVALVATKVVYFKTLVATSGYQCVLVAHVCVCVCVCVCVQRSVF